MNALSRMIRTLMMLSVAGIFVGCGGMPSPFAVKDRSPKSDSDAPFDPPNTYPEWSYDAPSYMRAINELSPEPKVNPSDPLHYFSNQKVVMIRQPDGYQPDEIPRVAVWWTDNNGFHWNKGGYFGRSQTFFPFEVEEDGDYGIRFVGPGQEPALQSLPYPERVYHVDTVLPEVEITVVPEKTWYHVGDEVTISWNARDFHLIEHPVRLGVLYDFSKDENNAIELQRDLADGGAITYTIPPEALEHEIRFRADALDRAGNLGVAISFALQVTPVEEDEVKELVDPDQMAGGAGDDGLESDGDYALEPLTFRYEDGGTIPIFVEDDFARASIPPEPRGRSSVESAELPPAVLASRAIQGIGDANWNPLVQAERDQRAAQGNASSAGKSAVANRPVKATDVSTKAGGSESELLGPPNVAAAHEATPDGDGPLPSRSSRVFDHATGGHPATPDAVPGPSRRPGEHDVLSAIGINYSDGLLVPMPATVHLEAIHERLVTAHPWRSLQPPSAGGLNLHLPAVWQLPTPHFDSPEVNRLLQPAQIARGRFAVPAGEPGAMGRAVAGVSVESLGSHVNVEP